MPSDEEFRELKDQVASLTSALATARRRIDDLEDGMADHLGLDWGESLVDVNSPHPNISANTIESGGGVIRQDAYGMQILAPADYAGIRWVSGLAPDPSNVLPLAEIIGRSDSSTPIGQVQLQATVTDGGTGQATVTAETGGSTFEVTLDSSSSVGNAFFSITHSDQGRLLAWNGAINLAGETDTGVLTPAQFTANQDNYAPTSGGSTTLWRLTSDASRDLTGIQAGSADLKLLFNVGSFDIVLKDESASSTAANRFALNGDITLQPDNSVGLWYDSTSSRWRAF